MKSLDALISVAIATGVALLLIYTRPHPQTDAQSPPKPDVVDADCVLANGETTLSALNKRVVDLTFEGRLPCARQLADAVADLALANYDAADPELIRPLENQAVLIEREAGIPDPERSEAEREARLRRALERSLLALDLHRSEADRLGPQYYETLAKALVRSGNLHDQLKEHLEASFLYEEAKVLRGEIDEDQVGYIPEATPPPESEEPLEDRSIPVDPEDDERAGDTDAEDGQDHNLVQVFFGTNRGIDKETVSGSDIRIEFDNSRADLTRGAALISIPKTHKFATLEGGSNRTESRRNLEKEIGVKQSRRMSKADFDAALAAHLAEAEADDAFVFIHGYTVSFNDAARRTGQMAFDMDFQGLAMFFAWPTPSPLVPSPRTYATSRENARWATADLESFLTDVVARDDISRVHLIAHSMGNVPLLETLENVALASRAEGFAKINKIVFAAPDIDQGVFVRIMNNVQEFAEDATLYSAANDKALWFSDKLRADDIPRAGDTSKGYVFLSRLDTIDATLVNTSFDGHNYFAANYSVLNDITEMIKENKRANDRSSLTSKSRGGGTVYVMNDCGGEALVC